MAHNTDAPISKVVVIGLGPMGREMARVLLQSGVQVTVWNRTASKASELEKLGARRADTVGKALTAGGPIILSLTDYDVMYSVLDSAKASLRGTTLINLSSDSPVRVREAARWAGSLGADFLSGGVMVDPPAIGTDASYILLSGERSVFDQYRSLISTIGRPEFLGTDPGLAMLGNQALINILFSSAVAVAQALAMTATAGLSGERFAPLIDGFLRAVPYFLADMPAEVDSGDYVGDQNSMEMMSAAAHHVVAASREVGVNSELPDLVAELFSRTVARGYGEKGLTSIFEVLKKDDVAIASP